MGSTTDEPANLATRSCPRPGTERSRYPRVTGPRAQRLQLFDLRGRDLRLVMRFDEGYASTSCASSEEGHYINDLAEFWKRLADVLVERVDRLRRVLRDERHSEGSCLVTRGLCHVGCGLPFSEGKTIGRAAPIELLAEETPLELPSLGGREASLFEQLDDPVRELALLRRQRRRLVPAQTSAHVRVNSYSSVRAHQ